VSPRLKEEVTSMKLIFRAFLLLLLVPVLSYSNSLTSNIELDHPLIIANKSNVVYAVIELNASTVEREMKRPKLNLSLVLDRSGSMADKGKMEYAKEAAKSLVGFLDYRDILSIVEYDDSISVLWPASPVELPHIVKSRIDELYPRGSTNLSGGMMKGADEVEKNLNSDSLNRVILLSDGLANRGIINPQEIKKIVQKIKASGVRISTMGLGLDYNEDLMLDIAENGGGNYYFIESPKQMKRIFEQELNTLFTTVAKDIKISFTFSPKVKNIEVFGYQAKQKQNKIDIDVENLYSGEKRTILIRMEIDPESKQKFDLGDLNIDYFDIEEKKQNSSKKSIELETTEDKSLYDKSVNNKIKSEALLIEADKKHEEYIKMYEAGNVKEAVKNIENLEKELMNQNSSLNNVELSKKIEALKMESNEIEEAEENFEQKQIYLKKSKQRVNSGKKGQRSKYIQQQGMQGYDVELLQEALQKAGFYTGDIDGIFTEEVKKAVIEFQNSNNLKPDGVAGPATLKKLEIY
jgi:Ca-activated chloride channel family protein